MKLYGWEGLYFGAENWIVYGLYNNDFCFDIWALGVGFDLTGVVTRVYDTYVGWRGWLDRLVVGGIVYAGVCAG